MGSDVKDYFDYMEGENAKDWRGEAACPIRTVSEINGLEFSYLLSALCNTFMLVGTESPVDCMMSVAFEI